MKKVFQSKSYSGIFLWLLGLFFSVNVFAQQIKVQGQVKADSGEPIIGANVVVKGTTNGTITDVDGHYVLSNVNPKSTLVFSFIGYLPQEQHVAAKSILNIVLQEDSKVLNEVVVIGYGTAKKSDLTGAVGSVGAKDLKDAPVANIGQALQGKVSGVQINDAGAPGDNVTIKIRGLGTINNSNPLVVIDGVPTDLGLSSINMVDVERVDVLKDASATAIYGSRGANGVVLISTKRGKSGKTTVSYDGYVGFQKVAKKLDMMNASEWGALANEGAANDGRPAYYTNTSTNPLYPAISDLGQGTDWQDEILRSSSPIHNHNITINGGSENTKFSVMASYFDQESIVKNQDFNRVSFRNNIDTKLSSRIDLSTSFTASRVTSNVGRENGDGGGNTSIINAALVLPPTVPVTDPTTGEYVRMNFLTGSSAVPNPVPYVEYLQDKGTIDRVLGSADLSIKLIEGLTLKVSVGADLSSALREVYEPKQTNTGYNANGIASQQNRRNQSLSNENVLTYLKKTGIHSINAMVGTSALSIESKSSSMTARDFISDAYGYNNLDAGAQWDKPSTGRDKNTLLSGFGRINYVLKDRYLFTVTGRADGSSKFGANGRFFHLPLLHGVWIRKLL